MRILVECWQNIDRLLRECKCELINLMNLPRAECWKAIGRNVERMLVECWENDERILEECWENIGRMLRECWQNIGRMLREYW